MCAPASASATPPVAYGFVIPLADEGPVQLEACLGSLRAAYPTTPVVVISDGVDHPQYPEICRRHRVAYQLGRYLKRIELGGAWWRRALEAGVALGTRWIIKLDPDACVARPFRTEPAFGIAGTLENPGTAHHNIQGGCQAIHRSVAERLLAGPWVDHPALRNHHTFDLDEPTRRLWRAQAYFSTDYSLMWLARQAGITVGDWPEVASRWQAPAPANPGAKFAVTHPHKLDSLPRYTDATLHVVTTCRGRLEHLRSTLPKWLAEPNVQVTVVDYGCPDGTAAYLAAHHPEVTVVRVEGATTFHLARARNIGAANLPVGADWVCFFDADWECLPGWAEAVRSRLVARHYDLANPIAWSQFGSVVVRLGDFRAAGGYDEVMTGWGAEDGDFYSRLRTIGVRPGSFPGRFFASIPHGDDARMEHYAEKDKKATQRVSDLYHHAKTRRMVELGRLTTAEENRAMRSEALAECGLPTIVPPLEPVTVTVFRPGDQAESPAAGGYASADGDRPAARLALGAPGARAASGPAPSTVPGASVASAHGLITAATLHRGPIFTQAFSVGDIRMETTFDLLDLLKFGLGSQRHVQPGTVGSQHVTR